MIKISPVKLNTHKPSVIQKNITNNNAALNSNENKTKYYSPKFAEYKNSGLINVNPFSFGALKYQKTERDKILDFSRIKTQPPVNDEKYQATIQEAYRVLGKKNVALICPGVCFPSLENDNTGYGTCNSDGAKHLMKYIKGMFNAIQLGPQGMTKKTDASPYAGTCFSLNILTIDLKSLTTPEWDNWLSEETYRDIADNNPSNGKNRADYQYALESYNRALDEVYDNFLASDDEELKEKFEAFKEENKQWLDSDALYEVLTEEYGNDYWPLWEGENAELDKHLYDKTTDEEAAQARKAELEEKYADSIERYKLIQFIASQQVEETKKYAQECGIKMIADRQVAYSTRDVWAHQSAFSDYCLGCPPDYFSEEGQAWGFAALNPDKIFNADGSYGEAGQLMYDMFYKMFKQNQGGVRIDHIIGLIDPWVYEADGKPNQLADGKTGRLYSTPKEVPAIGDKLGKYSIISASDCDQSLIKDENGNYTNLNLADNDFVTNLSDEQVDRYARIVNDIVLKAAQDAGLEKDAIIAEDLGTLTYPVKQVMERLELNGIRVLQFTNPKDDKDLYRCRNISKKSWVAPGTHDNQSIWTWPQGLSKEERNRHAAKLYTDLYSRYENGNEIMNQLKSNDKFLSLAKLTEAFACDAENVQISFMDFFGYRDSYNVPGTSDDSKNWNLRLRENYANDYAKGFEKKRAMNLPYVLSCAIRARGKDFIKQNRSLLNELDRLAFSE